MGYLRNRGVRLHVLFFFSFFWNYIPYLDTLGGFFSLLVSFAMCSMHLNLASQEHSVAQL